MARISKVHLCHLPCCRVGILTEHRDFIDVTTMVLNKLCGLHEHTARAAAWIYKDVIFDTSPVAGKVYKNSENRRKQGVSCGFRCICRCSICPIRAQPRCP